ncbi:hypothetical protein CcI49_11350 [Frankia sp. CcI49]|nr:hypothetical protein CcI49_11350 [Frankia sp. CcI49]
MSVPTSLEASISCRELIVAFAHHLDHREFDQVAALFSEDGVWVRHGEHLAGRTQIHDLLLRRPANQVERHVMTTMRVTQRSATRCDAVSYVMIFRSDRGSVPPAVVAGPSAVGEFHDRFLLTAEGWKFTHRSSESVFVIQPPV